MTFSGNRRATADVLNRRGMEFLSFLFLKPVPTQALKHLFLSPCHGWPRVNVMLILLTMIMFYSPADYSLLSESQELVCGVANT